MNAANVVLDTNVLIAALKSKKGGSYKLLMAIDDDLYIPNISVPLFLEYEAITKKKGMLPDLSEEDIDNILNFLLKKSHIRKIFFLWRPFLKDPKDDLVLEVAVKSQSDFIITFNKKDFRNIDKFGVQAVTPKEFLIQKGVLK